jgi:hypothetical protein
MAKQKVLPFGKHRMRGFFTQERDDSFSSAGRGTEMSALVCVGLWQNAFPIIFFDNLEVLIQIKAPKPLKGRSDDKASEL